MSRPWKVTLTVVASTAALYAYFISDGLIREFTAGLTWVDVGTLFVMGVIVGLALGTAAATRREGPGEPG